MNDTKLRSVRIPLKLDAKLAERAERLDRPVSWVIVKALEDALGVTKQKTVEETIVETHESPEALKSKPKRVANRTTVKADVELKDPAPAVEAVKAVEGRVDKTLPQARPRMTQAQVDAMARQARLNAGKG
jgi:predicted transcriptional regulator